MKIQTLILVGTPRCVVWRTARRAVPTVIALLLLALPAVVQAQFSYTTNNGTITITGGGFGSDVVIPDTINGLPVTSIGYEAFYEHYTLASLTIPNSVTNIGDDAFGVCINLTSLTIPNSVISIGNGAFEFCSGLASVTIPASVTNIGDEAFYWCNSLASVTIGNGVTYIGNRAFEVCENLTNLTIGNSVTSISHDVFEDCHNLIVITVDTNNPVYSSVNGVLFDKNQATLVLFPEGIFGSYTIPESVTSIGADAFYGCSGLTSMTIPDSVASIGDSAFQFCTGLTNVTIGNTVTSIGDEAFDGCGLTSVTIPNSVTNIGEGAFDECSSLTVITVETNNPVYSSMDGVVFDKGQTTLILCPQGISGNYTIPNSVTNIGDDAFYGCYDLTNVTIGNSVISIGDGAFEECGSLTNVTIGNGVTSIGDYAFSDYWGLGDFPALTSVYFKGNAPAADGSVFVITSYYAYYYNATAYYLPGTTGWADFSANTGIPAVPWQPLIQPGDARFGGRTNQFGFNIAWAGGQTVVVEACTNLANPVWSPVATNTLTGDSSYFSDPQSSNYPARFYRLRSP